MVRCTEQTAGVWQWVFSLFRRKHHIDQTREAKLVLQSAVSECDEAEQKITQELQDVATKVKDAQRRNIPTQVKSLLMNSRQKRKSLQVIQKKRITLQRQQETLESCELNEKVINSMKRSSAVLKDAGLEQHLKDADEALYDMQSSMEVAGEITSVLGDVPDSEWDDADMEAELRCLMDEDFYCPIETPPSALKAIKTPEVSNSMQTKTEVDKMDVVPEEPEKDADEQRELEQPETGGASEGQNNVQSVKLSAQAINP